MIQYKSTMAFEKKNSKENLNDIFRSSPVCSLVVLSQRWNISLWSNLVISFTTSWITFGAFVSASTQYILTQTGLQSIFVFGNGGMCRYYSQILSIWSSPIHLNAELVLHAVLVLVYVHFSFYSSTTAPHNTVRSITPSIHNVMFILPYRKTVKGIVS